MEAVDFCADAFVSVWKRNAERRRLAGLFVTISIVGSVLKDLDLVPETSFNDSKNVLNVVFVKFSWGWMLLLLTPFLLITRSSWTTPLTRLATATAIWYVCTEAFNSIEEWTGECADGAGAPMDKFTTKGSCRKAGFRWSGHDISGHSFILAYSALIIAEEIAPVASWPRTRRGPVPNLLYVALNAIVILWVWMFTCTSVYFHHTIHKLLGTLFGVAAWYLTYHSLFQHPLFTAAKEQK